LAKGLLFRKLRLLNRFPFSPASVLAPMEGVTNAAVREVLASYGPVGLVCTEFVRIAGEKISRPYLLRQVEKLPQVPLSVQVMGNDPELMAEAGAVVAEAGADVVDLNLGCPTSNAARKGVGAALLKEPLLLSRLLSTMRRSVPGRLSAKLRAGFEHTDEALTNARLVEDNGLDFLAVHPRRGVDHYRGSADWRIVERIRRELSIPVVGNGDLWYADSALRMFEQTNCDAVMIGRPALRNPWIFRQISELLAGHTAFQPSGHDVALHVQRLAAVPRTELCLLAARPVEGAAQLPLSYHSGRSGRQTPALTTADARAVPRSDDRSLRAPARRGARPRRIAARAELVRRRNNNRRESAPSGA
jgi:tRNA-dihydrouridine synthase B